jgi:acyl-CoA hydrolase
MKSEWATGPICGCKEKQICASFQYPHRYSERDYFPSYAINRFCTFAAMKKRKPQDSFVSSTEFVLPNDTNTLNNMMGGRMMHLMDIVAAISAQRHSGRIVVTASVDNLNFTRPIPLGSVVTISAKVTRAFNSSMEVHVVADIEDNMRGIRERSNDAFFTFVAVDQNGRPIDVPEIEPETEEDWKLYNGAIRRRQVRLILAGRMKPEDAEDLKALFNAGNQG